MNGMWALMNVRQVIAASLNLLSKRDRRRLAFVTGAQMSASVLDLVGVLLLGLVTALAVSGVSDSQPPEIIESFIARVGLENTSIVTLSILLAVAAGFLLISKSVINVLLSRRILRFLANRQAMVAGELSASLLSRPILEVQRRSSQEITYALTSGVSYATLTILGQSVVAVTEISLMALLAVGLLLISPLVTVFAIAFFLLIALILHRILSGWAGRLGERYSLVEVASLASIQEALRNYREATVSNRRGLYVNRFQELRWQTAMVQSDLQFMSLIPKYVFEVALILGAGVLAGSQFLVHDLSAALSIIVVFLAAGSRVVPSMLRLQTAAITIRSAAGQAAPTFELAHELDTTEAISLDATSLGETDPAQIRKTLEEGFGDFLPRISVRNCSFTYPDATTAALIGISLELPPGSSLALVGPTGAGKSTLADLILGVIEAEHGSVEIGGISPAAAIARWPGSIAYVPQDVGITNGTVRENVALGLPLQAINDARVWNALERSQLASILRDSKDGLDTLVGEHGFKFSGGQRQRLGMARALYTLPRLLVLDEATSALDAATEESIGGTLRDLEGKVTTITIAHRLATIRHCDLVAYLEGGQLLAIGSFETVRQSVPNFDMQATLLGL